MASCPNCGKKLHWWQIKAECSECGVSIPNFNWVERLEEDNINAEKSFELFYKTINRVKYTLFGTRLRIARLVLTFLPALAFLFPWASVNGQGNCFELALVSLSGGKSAIDIMKQLIGNSSLIFTNIKFENFGGPVSFITLSIVFYLLTIVFIVLAFLLNIIKCKQPKTKSTFIFDVIAIIFSIVSVVLFSIAASAGNQFSAFSYGDISSIEISGGFLWGYIPALILFLAATIINIAVAAAPAKSDEELESIRVAKKEAREAKEREDELKKQKAREEAAKAYEEEQKNIIAEARRKVAEKKSKDEAKANKRK